MGSYIEFNDTLQITAEQGFPVDLLDLAKHQNGEVDFADIKDKIFEFKHKPKARLFHPAPCRCFLVQNLDGKWLYWGKIIMQEQTIALINGEHFTSGKYKIIEIYPPEYQKQITMHESRSGESYFT